MHVLVYASTNTTSTFPFSPFFHNRGLGLEFIPVDVDASFLKSIFVCIQISFTICVILVFQWGLYFYCVSLLWQWCSKFSLFFPFDDAEENFIRTCAKGNFSFSLILSIVHKKYSLDCRSVNKCPRWRYLLCYFRLWKGENLQWNFHCVEVFDKKLFNNFKFCFNIAACSKRKHKMYEFLTLKEQFYVEFTKTIFSHNTVLQNEIKICKILLNILKSIKSLKY